MDHRVGISYSGCAEDMATIDHLLSIPRQQAGLLCRSHQPFKQLPIQSWLEEFAPEHARGGGIEPGVVKIGAWRMFPAQVGTVADFGLSV